MRSLLAFGVLCFVIGCESDDKKLARLESAKLTDCLLAEAAQHAFDSAGGASLIGSRGEEMAARQRGDTATANRLGGEFFAGMKARGLDTMLSNTVDSRRKCDLAAREYDRFMR